MYATSMTGFIRFFGEFHPRIFLAHSINKCISALERLMPGCRFRECPCCNWKGFKFRNFAVKEYVRADAMCPRCASLERHRALYFLYDSLLKDFPVRPLRILHFAAEGCLAEKLISLSDCYETSAYDKNTVADFHFDLTDLDLPDESYGVLLMNHVLDCMPDDHRAVQEMYRVLKPEGVVLGAISFQSGVSTRELPVASNSRHRIYGSVDIAERFSPFDTQIVNVSADYDVRTRRRYGLPSMIPIIVLRKVQQGTGR